MSRQLASRRAFAVRSSRMWRGTLIAAWLLLAPGGAVALDCPAGARAMTGSAGRVLRVHVDGLYCDACVAEWCERDAPYGMVVLDGPLRLSFGDTVRALGRVSNGERRWRWTVFDHGPRPRGHAILRGAWRLGRRSGHWTGWWPNGTKSFDGRYVAGERHGRWREWYEDGRLRRAGAFDHDDEVGTWQVHDQATDQLLTETHSWPPPEAPAPCFPRRVPGGLRPPPLPTIEFAGFAYQDRELHARFRLTNPYDEPACYVGFDAGTPALLIERLTFDGWESPDLSWVCAGPPIDVRFSLQPHESIEAVRPLGRDDRPFRATITVPPAELGQRVYARTPRVDVPRARTSR